MARSDPPTINPRLRAALAVARDDAGPARSFGRRLPDSATCVVIGGGYAGLSAARALAQRGVAATLVEARTLGFGASTRNGGIVHPGYKWGPRQLVKRYGKVVGPALYQDTARGYETIKRVIADERSTVGSASRLHRAGACRRPRSRPPAGARQPRRDRRRVTRTSRRSTSGTRSAATSYHGGLVVPVAACSIPAATWPGSLRPRTGRRRPP
jgi:glycine/D-amino acid oxidase-like deaminating enzyme